MKQRHLGFAAWICAAVLVLSLMVVGVAQSQVISGDLVGIILDKSGSAVPNAAVTATNVDTGVKHESVANGVGEYRFINLPVGTYNVSATAKGFATTTVNNYHVDLNKTSTLQITLEVTGTTTSIEVVGGVTTLDTTTSQLSTTFENNSASTMAAATSGEGVLNLSLMSAGVGTSGGVGAGTGPSVGGQRPRDNNFTIEGVDNNDKSVTGPLVYVPNDAVAEFSLLQNNYSAEFGHSNGGQFNTVVRSGTNDFHGLAYIYNDNRNYNALDVSVADEGLGSGPQCATLGGSYCSSPGPRYDFNRIGGQVGGPILKNKLFFFVNYEYQPLGQAGGSGNVCAPTAAGMAIINSYPGLSQINVSEFEKYVSPGTIPSSNCTPLDFPGVTGGVPTAGLAILAPNYSNGKYLTVAGDWDISSKDQLRARYIWNNVEGIDTAANLPVFYTSVPSKYYLVTINEYHQFTTNVQNEFRVGYNRYSNSYPAGNFTFPGLDMFPNLVFYDLNQLQLGPDGNAPQSGVQNTYQFSDAVSWIKGAHSMKFGFEGRKLIAPQDFTQRLRGDYEYSNLLTYLQDGVPDVLAQRSNGDTPYWGDQTAWYWYANDNWRIKSNLTLNLGLRYELTTTPYSERLFSLNAIASYPGLITFAAPRPAYNDWAPKIGFAYSPGTDGKTSIRGGFSIGYDVLFDNLGLDAKPPELSQTLNCNVGTTTCAAPFLKDGGIPPGPGGTITFPTQAAAAQATSGYLPNQTKDPKALNWTLGIQHQFASDYTFEARYLGTRGIHLPAQIIMNEAPGINVASGDYLPTYFQAPSQATLNALPLDLNTLYNNATYLLPSYNAANFNGNFMTGFLPWGSSDYNGLAVQMTKKMAHGLQFIGAYTYSKTIDDSTAEVHTTDITPRRPQDSTCLRCDYSDSILDHRHRFTMAVLYDVPFFKGSNWVMKNVVGNWTLAPMYTYQSGQWATVQSTIDSNINGDTAGDRAVINPNGIPGTGSGVIPLCNSTVPVGQCPSMNDLIAGTGNPAGVVGYLAANPSAQYVTAGFGANANAGRNTLQFKPINNIDMTASKRISITERFKVEFQAQAFNLFNHPQYVGGSLNDVGSYGYTGGVKNILNPANASFNQDNSGYLASNARTLQLALKFSF